VTRASLVVAGVVLLTALSLPSAAAAGPAIRITDGLDPIELHVRPGTTITFRNDDGQRHRLRSRAGARFDTGNLEPGEAIAIRFTVPGSYPYVDERDRDATAYHGTIVVGDAVTAGGTPATAPGGTTTPAAKATIHLAGRRFDPSAVTVRAGAVVTFRNDDDRDHTASSRDGAFDTGILAAGSSEAVTLTTPGSYRYLCLIHPEMTGTITVAAPTDDAVPTPATPAPAAPTPAATVQPTPVATLQPTPDPTSEATPGPTILEARVGATGPSDAPEAADPAADEAPSAAVDTGSAGRLLLVVLVSGVAIGLFARLVAGTRRRSPG
jgi:plastocyanin